LTNAGNGIVSTQPSKEKLMTPEEIKKRARLAINKLSVKMATENDKLQTMKADHTALWNTYGSELCAREMSKKEEKLANKIAAIEKDIKLLQLFASLSLTDKDLDSGLEINNRRIRKEKDRIQESEEIIKYFKKNNAEYRKIKNLLRIR
jgi:hypothetical protein